MSIKLFPTIFFVSISLIFYGCSPRIPANLEVSRQTVKISTFQIKDSETLRLKTTIIAGNSQLSGITIVKQKADTTFGVFINEFGLKGFEFKVVGSSCELLRMLKKMDKWYIRKTISNDLAYIFAITNPIKTGLNEYTARFRKQSYIYTMNSNELEKSVRMNNGRLSGKMTIEDNSVFIFENTKRKLIYRFQLIKN
jgi:hypothetical protein